jgi:hypothetical protein
MKRSIMLEIIEKRLRMRNSGHYSYNSAEHAELILQAIESAGMLPPSVFLKKTGSGCLCTMREGCQECDPYGKYYTNKWEND